MPDTTSSCPSCGAAASPAAKFCEECGTALPARCPRCGSQVSRKAKFCPECGTALDGPSSTTERRQLTVFFCDLVGSTALSASMDPEDFRELIQSYQSVCGRVISELDGHIAQFLGDGILAYFGYPRAHEDDARRAVEAALRIMTDLERLESTRQVLRLRIGIHTGEVVVGTLGESGHEEQLALGETPNIAARVEAAAGANEVLVSDATWRLARTPFQFEALGPRELKGISRPITLYRLLGRSSTAGQPEAEPARTPFTGRRPELEHLKSAWLAASAGQGRVVRIGGEPGLGKSRLVAELSDYAQQNSGSVVVCRCSPYHRTSALYPFIDLLTRDLGFQRRESNDQKRNKLSTRMAEAGAPDGDAARLLESLLTIAEPGVPAPDLTPQRKRQLTFESIGALLAARSASSPLLFLMEDLHWADPSTVELLGTFLEKNAAAPILAALTYRPEFEFPWQPRVNETVISLKPLQPEETAFMVRRVAQDAQIPAAVFGQLLARTEGVPLFIEEVTKAVLESGRLSDLDESGELPTGLIPATVRDSLTARLDRLGEARETLRLASVLGRDFSFRVLHVVADTPENVLAKALQKAEETGLVYRSSDESSLHYIFKHALIQDAAYSSLVRKTRQQYHERIARKLTEHFPEIAAEQPELIATHFESAACHKESAEYWLHAGERASARGAVHEAMSHMDAALKALAQLPESDPQRYRLELAAQMQLMSARMAAFGWASNEVEESCLRARELAGRLQDGAGLFGALWGLWAVYFLRGQLREGLDVALQVFQMAGQIGTPTFKLAGRHAVGYTRYFRGEFTEARQNAVEGIAVGTPEAIRETVQVFQLSSMACVRGFYSASLWMLGETTASARELRTNLEQVAELRHGPTTAQAIAFALYIYHFWHALDMIRADARLLLQLSEREGYAMWVPMAHMYLAWCDAMEADPKTSRSAIEDAAQKQIIGRLGLHATRTELMYVQDMVMSAEALHRAGRGADALDTLDQAIAKAASDSQGVMLPEAFRLRGQIYAESGNLDRAHAELEEAMRVAARQSALSLELRAAQSMRTLLRLRGEEYRGGELVERVSGKFRNDADVAGALHARFPDEFRYVPRQEFRLAEV
ncbi:MAG: AAA family ATPase [Acidobacteriaceae bacterium]|nr:AAA family ATPase [Acidobacteriaceae bacterium]